MGVTAICVLFQVGMTVVWFSHLQTNWPHIAQRWTKLLAPFLYKKQMSHAAVDELVQDLRYLQKPRDKTLTVAQLRQSLESYFANNPVLSADQSAFLQFLEAEAGGRL